MRRWMSRTATWTTAAPTVERTCTSIALSGSHVEREVGAEVHINPVAAAELAEAERALALHHATEEISAA